VGRSDSERRLRLLLGLPPLRRLIKEGRLDPKQSGLLLVLAGKSCPGVAGPCDDVKIRGTIGGPVVPLPMPLKARPPRARTLLRTGATHRAAARAGGPSRATPTPTHGWTWTWTRRLLLRWNGSDSAASCWAARAAMIRRRPLGPEALVGFYLYTSTT